MTKKILTSSILALGLFFNNAIANNTNNTFYGGIGVAKTTLKDSPAKYDEINFKLTGGTKIKNNISAEIQFVKFKEGEFYHNGIDEIDADGRSIGITALYHFNNSSSINPFVKLGIHNWSLEAVNKANGLSVNESGTDLISGLGVDFINDGFTTRVEYESYKMGGDVDENMNSFGANILFDF